MTGNAKAAAATLDEARERYDGDAAADQLEAVYSDADKAFGAHNPERLAQLRSALDTARMAVEHLSTETPYRVV
jgi:formate-dependent nitrite reductase cytochrome c552 subunit